MADMVRQVPARKTLQTALENLPAAAAGAQEVVTGSDCGCATAEVAARAETQEHPSTV
jgi:hypothetical protein